MVHTNIKYEFDAIMYALTELYKYDKNTTTYLTRGIPKRFYLLYELERRHRLTTVYPKQTNNWVNIK